MALGRLGAAWTRGGMVKQGVVMMKTAEVGRARFPRMTRFGDEFSFPISMGISENGTLWNFSLYIVYWLVFSVPAFNMA